MARKLTKLRLLSELRKLLRRPDTTVTERKLDICGHSRWVKWVPDTPGQQRPEGMPPVQDIRIVVDPRRDGLTRVVIHELLHVYMDLEFELRSRLTYEIEETAVLGWEEKLYDWLHDHADELESWTRAIARKKR